jgi:hypothetical protein
MDGELRHDKLTKQKIILESNENCPKLSQISKQNEIQAK